MTEILKSLIVSAKENPKTTALGLAAAAFGGAGEAMQNFGFEPWGSIVIGLAGLLVVVAGMVAKDKPKTPPGDA
jgi:hypothetical protein